MPTETGSGSSGTPRPRSPSPSGPETAGLPTTWLPTSPSSRAEPGHTSAAGDPTTGAQWLWKQQGNLASTVTPNVQTCLSRAVKPGNPIPENGLFPISLSGVTGSRLAYHIRQDFQVKKVEHVKTTALAQSLWLWRRCWPVPTRRQPPFPQIRRRLPQRPLRVQRLSVRRWRCPLQRLSLRLRPFRVQRLSLRQRPFRVQRLRPWLRPARLRPRRPRQHPSRPQRPSLRLCRNRRRPRE